jgi:hypothetical protein
LNFFNNSFFVLQPLDPAADDMVYADSDYKDLYDYGPVSYQQASRQAVEKKKEEAARKFGGNAR